MLLLGEPQAGVEGVRPPEPGGDTYVMSMPTRWGQWGLMLVRTAASQALIPAAAVTASCCPYLPQNCMRSPARPHVKSNKIVLSVTRVKALCCRCRLQLTLLRCVDSNSRKPEPPRRQRLGAWQRRVAAAARGTTPNNTAGRPAAQHVGAGSGAARVGTPSARQGSLARRAAPAPAAAGGAGAGPLRPWPIRVDAELGEGAARPHKAVFKRGGHGAAVVFRVGPA